MELNIWVGMNMMEGEVTLFFYIKGQWNEEGQRHGFGQLVFSDQAKYCGRFENGLFAGLGSVTYPDGSKYLEKTLVLRRSFYVCYGRYDGEFFQGLYHGLGVFIRSDGMKYEGQFQDGKIHGLGLVTFADGSHGVPRNEGYFENNKLVRHEKCTRIIEDALAIAQQATAQQTT